MAVHESVLAHPQWNRLAALVHDLAFLDGGSDDAFTLASGRNSRWFFDTKPVMMHPEAAGILGALLNVRMKSLEADFVGGLELGAVPLTAIVITSPDATPALRGFMVRKGTQRAEVGVRTNNPPGIEGSSLDGGRKGCRC